MDALDDALRVIASLNKEGVNYVVVGGVALNLHGLIRATEDPSTKQTLRHCARHLILREKAKMSLTKFRSVTEMPTPIATNGADLVARIRALWQRSFLLCPPSGHVGVKRFATHEEANEDRMRVTQLRMKRARPNP